MAISHHSASALPLSTQPRRLSLCMMPLWRCYASGGTGQLVSIQSIAWRSSTSTPGWRRMIGRSGAVATRLARGSWRRERWRLPAMLADLAPNATRAPRPRPRLQRSARRRRQPSDRSGHLRIRASSRHAPLTHQLHSALEDSRTYRQLWRACSVSTGSSAKWSAASTELSDRGTFPPRRTLASAVPANCTRFACTGVDAGRPYPNMRLRHRQRRE